MKAIIVLFALLGSVLSFQARGQTGIISTVAGGGASGLGDGGPAISSQLAAPGQIAVDVAGNLYVADTRNQRVRKVSTAGIITTIAGNGVPGFSGDGGLAASSSLSVPEGVAVDASGNIFIADTGNSRIRKVSPAASSQRLREAGTLTPAMGDRRHLPR
jgi:hypothetical protein